MVKKLMMLLLMLQTQTPTDLDRYRKDYVQIMGAYQKHASMSFYVSYNDHENSSVAKPDTSLAAKYYFKGKKFYYKLAGTEILRNDDYYITVNHAIKTITVGDAHDIKMDFLPVYSIDSVLKRYKVVVHYSEKDNGKKGSYQIEVYDPTKPFNKVEMDFDKNSYLVNKVRMFVSQEKMKEMYEQTNRTGEVKDPSIEYIYSNYQFNDIDDKVFSSARFIYTSGKDLKASAQYAKYKVMKLVTVQTQSQ